MVRFDYYSADPTDFKYKSSDGCRVGSWKVQHMSEGFDYMACVGAEELGLPAGRYVAVQADSDRGGAVIIGYGWIVEVAPPTTTKARIVS